MRSFVLAASSLAVMTCTDPLFAQSLEENFDSCINGAGKIANEEIVAACSSLIDQAQAENETVGFFYAMRATASTDRERNCADGLKAKILISDPKLADPIEQIISQNC